MCNDTHAHVRICVHYTMDGTITPCSSILSHQLSPARGASCLVWNNSGPVEPLFSRREFGVALLLKEGLGEQPAHRRLALAACGLHAHPQVGEFLSCAFTVYFFKAGNHSPAEATVCDDYELLAAALGVAPHIVPTFRADSAPLIDQIIQCNVSAARVRRAETANESETQQQSVCEQ